MYIPENRQIYQRTDRYFREKNRYIPENRHIYQRTNKYIYQRTDRYIREKTDIYQKPDRHIKEQTDIYIYMQTYERRGRGGISVCEFKSVR